MGIRRGSFSSTPSSLSPLSAEDSADFTADRMELEAAEALADLAQLAMRERVSEPAARWGSKGKRLRKRVNRELPPCDSRLNQVDSVPPSPDLAEDQAVQQQAQAICRNITIKPVEIEHDAESLEPSPECAPRYTSTGGGRSRQNLTEAEKEERRVRRVLANRESARQTIRRRQALCEELTIKAADLARENEILKREKEFALKQYQSLETINQDLKEQMSKAKKLEIGKASGELKSTNVEISASPSTTCPLYLYNQHPFKSLCWPPIIQSSHLMQSQHGPHNALIIPSSIPMSAPDKLVSSQELENPVNNNGPITPLYIVPGSWFFPLPDHGNGLHPQPAFGMKNIKDNILVNNHYSAISSLNVTDIESQTSHFPIKVNEEASGSTEFRPINDLNEAPVGFPNDGSGHHIGLHPKETMLGRAPQSSAGPTFIAKRGSVLQSEYASKTGAISAKSGRVFSSLPKKNQGVVDQPSKKLVDTVAAAEARKRRKELTRLKSIHGRQCRMHV